MNFSRLVKLKSKKALLAIILIAVIIAVVTGIKVKNQLSENQLTKNVKEVQQSLNAQWAKIKFQENNILITGQTIDSETHKLLITQLTKVEGINTVTSKVKISRPLTPKQCQQQIDLLLASDKIQFVKKNSKINPTSHDLLQQIADSLWLCPDTSLLIIAHTSNEDDVEDNIETSELRSSTVLNYFNDNLGFSSRQIAAVGMGAAFPVVKNDSDANRTLNERIEIRIR